MLDIVDIDKVIFTVAGRVIPAESFSMIRNYDTLADAATIVFPWEPGADPSLDAATLPYRYSPVTVSIGGILQLTGRVYDTKQSRAEDGRRFKTITAYSPTVDIIDCVVNAPHMYKAGTLQTIVSNQALSYGIPTVVDPSASNAASIVFPVVTSKLTDNMFDFLSGLSKQRGCLLGSLPNGSLLIHKYVPGANDLSIESIREFGKITPGTADATQFEANFEGRKRFSFYAAIVSRRNQYLKAEIFADPNIPGKRTTRFEVNESSALSLLESVSWAASKGLADAMTMPFPVAGWRGTTSQQLWRPGQVVNVSSDTMSLKAARMLIRSVEFKLDSTGKRSILSMVPPEVYSGQVIKDVFE